MPAMNNELKNEYEKRNKEEHTEMVFLCILFLTAFGLTLLSIFIFAFMFDFFGLGITEIPDW